MVEGGDKDADGWDGWDVGPGDSLLLERLEEAQRQVRAAQLVARHGMPVSLAELAGADSNTVSRLLRQLLQRVSANAAFTDTKCAAIWT